MKTTNRVLLVLIAGLAIGGCKDDSKGKTTAYAPNSAHTDSDGWYESDGRYQGRQYGPSLQAFKDYENYSYTSGRDDRRSHNLPDVRPDSRYPGFLPQCTVQTRSDGRQDGATLISVQDGERAMIKVYGRLVILTASRLSVNRRRGNAPETGLFADQNRFPILRGSSYNSLYLSKNKNISLVLVNTYRQPLRGPLERCSGNDSARLSTTAILTMDGRTSRTENLEMSCEAICGL